MEDVDDSLLLRRLDFLGQPDDFLLQRNDGVDISAQRLHSLGVDVDNLRADELNFVVGASRDFVDEVSDRQLSAL